MGFIKKWITDTATRPSDMNNFFLLLAVARKVGLTEEEIMAFMIPSEEDNERNDKILSDFSKALSVRALLLAKTEKQKELALRLRELSNQHDKS